MSTLSAEEKAEFIKREEESVCWLQIGRERSGVRTVSWVIWIWQGNILFFCPHLTSDINVLYFTVVFEPNE
jgi:hypothetical protein